MSVAHIDSERFRRGEVSPETVLRFALEEIEAGRMATSKLLLVSVEDSGARYDIRAINSGLGTVEYIALLERIKHHVLMGAHDA